MSSDILKKVEQLPPDKQQEVEDFVNYLVSKYLSGYTGTETLSEKRQRNMGWAKGTIWMAEDFNDTPEDFKDYL